MLHSCIPCVSRLGSVVSSSVHRQIVAAFFSASSFATMSATKKAPRPVVLAGPSGCGKSTLIKRLMDDIGKDKIGFSVSHTTRKPREGEQEGVHYHYVSPEVFEQLIQDNAFVEHATFSGNRYGTSKRAVLNVLQQGKLCLLDIDMQGVRNVKQTDLNAVCIFIKPPNVQELEKRLRGRGTESEEAVQKRLNAATAELKFGETPGTFDYTIINDDLDKAYSELKDVITKVMKENSAL
ncbi:uncharacterized protein LOC129602864 [Paramacrobiotus metropolitanus]|uniref:uncharacterized protein LOC129602864 n=1 Tax=Paramacrobiotus metropolitanus TaxID=2943436 RepID=UPI00244592A7|nr:uncharacterized protein LOC129602864 [Paramacrobiotus metropolitanus]